MFGLGMGELIVILALALIVLGPKKLPDIATTLGKAIRSFRKATQDLGDQLEVDESVRQPLRELKAALRDEPAPRPAQQLAVHKPAATVPVDGAAPAGGTPTASETAAAPVAAAASQVAAAGASIATAGATVAAAGTTPAESKPEKASDKISDKV